MAAALGTRAVGVAAAARDQRCSLGEGCLLGCFRQESAESAHRASAARPRSAGARRPHNWRGARKLAVRPRGVLAAGTWGGSEVLPQGPKCVVVAHLGRKARHAERFCEALLTLLFLGRLLLLLPERVNSTCCFVVRRRALKCVFCVLER